MWCLWDQILEREFERVENENEKNHYYVYLSCNANGMETLQIFVYAS